MKTKQTRKTPSQSRRVSAKKTPLHARVRSHAKHVLVPHKGNSYRPHLIRVHGLVAVLVIALLAQVVYGFTTTGRLSVLAKASDISTVELLTSTNAEREKEGAGSLAINAQLSDAAFLKAKNMFEEQYWSHVSPSGTQPWKWFGDAGYNYSYAGENLAKNYPSAEATVAAWMSSPTHRENVLRSEYVDVGFAVVDGVLEGQPTTLVVALYGAPAVVAGSPATEGAAVATPTFSSSSVATGQNPVTYFGAALEALSPVTLVVLGLLAVVAIVGALTHHHRDKLPKAIKKGWKAHHGMYTFVGMIALGVLVIIATGGGSI